MDLRIFDGSSFEKSNPSFVSDKNKFEEKNLLFILPSEIIFNDCNASSISNSGNKSKLLKKPRTLFEYILNLPLSSISYKIS